MSARDEIRAVFAAEEIARQLDALAKKADKFQITLGNGGEVGSMLGAIATDIRNNYHYEEKGVREVKP